MAVYSVEVRWTSARPIQIDQHRSYCLVEADSPSEALEIAAQMAAAGPGWQMTTSARLIGEHPRRTGNGLLHRQDPTGSE